MTNYVPDNHTQNLPKLPTKRPPTRAEVYAYWSAYFEGRRDEEYIVAWCREYWTSSYAYWHSVKAWRKQPDWVEGDAVIPPAVPDRPFYPEQRGEWYPRLRHCLLVAGAVEILRGDT